MAWHDVEGRLADPTPEEFQNWIAPADAFAELPEGITPALAATLVRRLKTKMLFAAARLARFGPTNVPRYVTSIDPTWWVHVEGSLGPDSPLWRYGDVTIVVPARGGDENTTVHFFDVRFERSGIRELIPGAKQRPAQALAAASEANPPDPLAKRATAETHWVSAQEAVAMIEPLYKHPALAREAIISEAAGDRLATRCDRSEVETDDEDPPIIHGRGGLNAEFWRRFKKKTNGREREDWTVGTFVFRRALDISGFQWSRAYGVEFSLQDLRKVFRLPEPPARVPLDQAIAQVAEAIGIGLLDPTPSAAPTSPPIKERVGQRKESPKPFVPDDRLTAWYEKRVAQFPDEVHRQVKVAAQRQFPKFQVGKNQLYDVMRAVKGKLKAGNPTFSRT